MISQHQSLDQLAMKQLQDHGPLSRKFLELGCHCWQDAWSYINQLPYRRVSDNSNFHLVLEEQCGTCSTKHALLVALAKEQNVPLALMVGLMEMTMERFPALASVFAKYHIDSMLETHCFLMFEKERLDVTFPQEITYPQASDYLEEWEITPEEIGSRKVKRHQEGMKRWMKEKNIPYPFEQVWKIREECIDRLSENTTS